MTPLPYYRMSVVRRHEAMVEAMAQAQAAVDAGRRIAVNLVGPEAAAVMMPIMQAVESGVGALWKAEGGTCFFETTEMLHALQQAGLDAPYSAVGGHFRHLHDPWTIHAWLEAQSPVGPVVVNATNLGRRPLYTMLRSDFRKLNRARIVQVLTAKRFAARMAALQADTPGESRDEFLRRASRSIWAPTMALFDERGPQATPEKKLPPRDTYQP